MARQMNKSSKKGNKNQSGAKPKVTVIKSRKDKRKQDRKLKKQTKLQFYTQKYHSAKSLETNNIESKYDTNEITAEQLAIENKQAIEDQKKKKREAADKLKETRRKRELRRANKEEDKNIKKLEKQLRLNKRKGKDKNIRLPSSFAEEGLDYLLDVCDSSKIESLIMSDEDNSENDEDQIEEVQGQKEEVQVDGDLNNEIEDEIMSESDQSDLEANSGSESDESNISSSQEENSTLPSGPNIIKEEKYWEDIYGRTRDSHGNVVKLQESVTSTQAVTETSEAGTANKYVPPALRAKFQTDNERILRLQKQIKGFLNRLAESNMHLICRQLEDLYANNSRNDMNECLCKLIISAIITSSGSTTTPERLVMEHAVLVGILHANVGNEVGAAMLQATVTQYNNKLKNKDTSCQDKHLENYLMLLCQLYAFRVTTDLLIFEILTDLAETFDTKSVELIVIALRSVGFLLRKDNPNKLKGLILIIQSNSAKQKNLEEDSRVKFMLEILLAIKNNNVKKIPNYDSSYQTHWQKIIKGFLRPGITQITPLKIGFEEMLNAESRGRWWIVGSAWAGTASNPETTVSQKESNATTPVYSSELLVLARKMRMNTDTRKNIFCALMSAEDFLEATERLVKLSLTTQQKEREVIFVILTCCLKEKSKFNPYYSQLAAKLSNIDRKYRMAAQFAIWDRIKEAESLEKFELKNLALFTSKLITEKVLSLACLKIIEFSEINKVLVKFLKICLLEIIESNDTIRKEVFLAVAGYPKLSQLREGLRIFMRHFILKETPKKNRNSDICIPEALKEKVLQAEQSLLAGDKKMAL